MKNTCSRPQIRWGFLACAMAFGTGPASVLGQYEDPIWSSGSSQIAFPYGALTQLDVDDLPAPTNASIPAQYRYNGTIAQRSQYAQYDRTGKLLFFAVDGNIYNADGYLIADAGLSPGDRNCQVCSFKGNEFHVVPVPGTCSRYYIISLFGAEDDGSEILNNGFIAVSQARSRIRIGVLDLTLQNDFPVYNAPNCSVHGRFLSLYERESAGYDLLQDFDEVEAYGISGDLVVDDPKFYLTEGSLHTGQTGVGMVHAASSQLESDGRVIMMARTGNRLVPILFTPSGGQRLAGANNTGYYPMQWWDQSGDLVHDVQDNDASFRGEIALRQVGNELRVAYSSYLDADPSQNFFYNENRVTYWKFQLFAPGDAPVLGFAMSPYSSSDPNPRQYSTDQTLPNTTDPPLDHLGNPIDRPSISGLEFSPSGQYLYFAKSGRGYEGTYSPNFGCIDVTLNCSPPPAVCNAFLFPNIGDPAISRRLVETQLGMNQSTYGTPSLYMIGADSNGDHWLSTFEDPDSPNFGVYDGEALALPSAAFRTSSSGNPQYRLLNHRVAGSTHYASIQDEICCENYVLIKDQNKPILPILQNWAPGSNVFCDAASTIFIAGDLVIPSGAVVNITGLEFRFGPDARLIVSRGARVNASYCTFTSACEERWAGIRVEGNTANTYQGNNPALTLDLEQGNMWLQACTIENAHYGVWCAREFEPDNADPNYYGGFVRAYGTTIRDCLNGVQVQNYHRFDANSMAAGPELPNRTHFASCTFETTANWPNGTPGWQAIIENVDHIQFLHCNFENSAPQLFPPDETGGGVFLFNANAYVDGNGDPESSYFRNLNIGLLNSSGPLNPVRVSRMHFENNCTGIADLESTFVEYGGNTFHVTDQGTAPNARVGMLLYQTHGLTVEENVFTGDNREHSVGIFFAGVRVDADGNPVDNYGNPIGEWEYNEERIYNNTFTNLQAGTLIQGLHRGSSSAPVDAGLQVLCGDYTDNLFDIAVLDRSIIRPNQGQIGASPIQNALAGNRFFNFADCASNFDWALDVNWNNVNSQTAAEINYRRHEFPELEVGVTCDIWPRFDDLTVNSFIDIGVPQSGTFDKGSHCGAGEYPIQQEGMGGHVSGYTTAKSLLTDAINAYEGTVDLGDTPDLKDAVLQSTPWLSSTYLRDLLMAKHPLSDDILALVIKREVPMDAWHLTQVLLQNSKLNPGIWQLVEKESTLSPYFRAMIAQAQQGTGLSVKQSLEHEIVHRRLQMAEHMNVLGHLYARDTIGTPSDSLEKLLLFDKDKENLMQKVNALIKLERYAEAQALLDGDLNLHIGKEVLEDLMAMQQSTNGNWKELSQADKDQLWAHAESGKAGAGQAAGILFSIGVDAPLPDVRFPNFTKSNRVTGGRREHYTSPEPTVACFPNPSDASSFLTYPAELDGTTLVVFDAKGSEVERQQLKGNGLVEIGTKGLPAGVYQVALLGTPFTTKLSVQH